MFLFIFSFKCARLIIVFSSIGRELMCSGVKNIRFGKPDPDCPVSNS